LITRLEQQQKRIEWRRNKVRELSIKGHNQRQIASILKVSLGLVNEDLQYFRRQAKENISKYIDEYLPAEYQNCLEGLNNIMAEAWQMSFETDSDKREKIQALSLAKECYAMKLDLLSSSTVVQRAVDFVERNRDYVEQYGRLRIGDTTQLRVANSNDVTESKQDTG
jgi:RecG-like helicase